MVLSSYLPYILQKAKEIKEEKKTLKLHTVDYNGTDYWGSINLDHPASFDTMAMDPKMKRSLIEDLDRFTRRKEFYRRVRKAWKRGYLLNGPPGTGKSSLVAAMANYPKFDVYDLDLKKIQCNSDLRRLLIGTGNRSIIVIEDIDCSLDFAEDDKDASNYLQIHDHPIFEEIKGLLEKVQATPAEVAGELMKSEDPDVALRELIKCLHNRTKAEMQQES
ncbi:hypothetical protein CRYUN_Cryun35bG0018800 [Craigia yunnanensis]